MGKDKLENMLAYLTGGSSRSDKACTDQVNAALAAIYDMFRALRQRGENLNRRDARLGVAPPTPAVGHKGSAQRESR